VLVLVYMEATQVIKVVFALTNGINLVFTFVALITVFWYYKPLEKARILCWAYTPLALTFTAILLRNMSVINNYPLIQQAVMLGFIYEVVTFTVTFALWYRSIENEKNVAELRLEVAQRDKQIAIQTAEQKIKDRIARDLHDDVAASMSGIRILSEVARNQYRLQTSKVGALLDQINQNAQETLESISDLIWAVKPGSDYLNDMADRMRNHAAKVLAAKDVDYQINIPRNLPIMTLDPEARRSIYLIYKEAINNTLKYSNCERVDIELDVEGDFLKFLVKDDGDGFNMDDNSGGNGLGNMAKRAQDIGADFELHSQPNKGTTIRLQLALKEITV
jgi:signal transduction histidine kinase